MILDLRPVTAYTDFFVLATGRNARQTKAIYDEVRQRINTDAAHVTGALRGATIAATSACRPWAADRGST